MFKQMPICKNSAIYETQTEIAFGTSTLIILRYAGNITTQILNMHRILNVNGENITS